MRLNFRHSFSFAALSVAFVFASFVGQADAVTGNHTVKAGETAAKIARTRGVSLGALLKANRLANPNALRAGQELVIPGNAATPPPAKKEAAKPVAKTTVKPGAQTAPKPAEKKAAPLPPAQPVINVIPPGRPATYVVQPGDTLSKLKRQHGLSVGEITALNKLDPNAGLRPGQRLRLRGDTPAAATPPATTTAATSTKTGKPVAPVSTPRVVATHVIQPKESFSAIARRHRVSVADLSQANPGVDPSRIHAGQSLRLPVSRAAAAEVPASVVPHEPIAEDPVVTRADGRILARQPDPLGFGGSYSAPQLATPVSSARRARTGYLVEQGENLTQIARRFRTTPSELRRLNRMGETQDVYAGRYIIVPFYTRPNLRAGDAATSA
jgi:LysM repeat protein